MRHLSSTGPARRRRFVPLALGLVILPLGVVLLGQDAPAVAPSLGVTSLAVAGDAAQAWEARVEALSRAGRLRLVSSFEDAMLEGRVHDRLDQYAGEARIVGGQVLRQRSASGVETVFGRLYPDDLGIETVPALSAEAAAERATALGSRGARDRRGPELVVLPLEDGTYRLAWLMHVALDADVVALCLDARTGDEIRRFSVLESQAAIGIGTGVRGDRKKLSTRRASGAFFAEAGLRPMSYTTYDLRSDHQRAIDIVFRRVAPTAADVAADADNIWSDGPVVDAHAGLGFAYDYFLARFNRHGIDGRDVKPLNLFVHPARRDNIGLLPPEARDNLVTNAFWCEFCSTDGVGMLVFGDGLGEGSIFDGRNVGPFSAGLDIVAHEYSHAVTANAGNLVYFSESGALNESFSDIMGISAEFHAAATGRLGRPANYLIGEDVFTEHLPGAGDGLRSAADPGRFGHPITTHTVPSRRSTAAVSTPIPGSRITPSTWRSRAASTARRACRCRASAAGTATRSSACSTVASRSTCPSFPPSPTRASQPCRRRGTSTASRARPSAR